MKPTILYRGQEFEEIEHMHAFDAGFLCTNSRMAVRERSLVVARYSCLPFYKELEEDLKWSNSRLINSYSEHRYIADLQNWYEDLKDLTPKTWRSVTEIPQDEKGPFVIKGETNSKKSLWNTHMFAADRDQIGQVIGRLLEDSLIKTQDLYIRKYEPMVTYMHGVNGIPITREFRFFVAYGEILSGGFYWSSHIEDLLNRCPQFDKKELDPNIVPREFLKTVIDKVKTRANGIVIDVAQRTDGKWRVIELNDLQMSGLSENNPKTLYENLFKVISSRS